MSDASRWSDEEFERVLALALEELKRVQKSEPRQRLARSRRREPAKVRSPKAVVPRAEPRYGRAVRVAATLSRFPLKEIEALAESAQDLNKLTACAVVDREDPAWRTLPPEIRTRVLRQVVPRDLDDAAAIQADDPLRNILQTITAPEFHNDALRERSVAELTALLHVSDAVVVPRRVIERNLELARVLEPLRGMIRTFRGRAKELTVLRDYVGHSSGKPLLLYGPGGIGKTTLVAKFLVDHALATERLPFAYLDFDRLPVSAEGPAALVIEAVRQLGLQFGDEVEDAANRLRSVLERYVRADLTSAPSTNKRVLSDLSSFLRLLVRPNESVLFVIDTFEEVQLRSSAYARAIVELMDMATRQVPMLRVVIAGRVPIAGLEEADQFELSEFDRETAIAFLVGHGLDEEMAVRVADRYGKSPLTLNLAVDAFRTAGLSVLDVSMTHVSERVIQGQLFDRILLHIYDPDVRKLVHPGLVLRRVTPELIREVLAVPCGVEVPTAERAQELFDGMAREVTLYSVVSPNIIVMRPDVRRTMLPMVREMAPRQVQEIHRRAARYYSGRGDVVSRAEEIYHRLFFEEETVDIESLITDDVKPYLISAFDELAAPEQAALAIMLNFAVAPEVWDAATKEQWERYTSRLVRESIETGDYDAATDFLGTREERTANTDLRVVEAQLQLAKNELENAIAAADAGIAAYGAAANVRDQFSMLLISAEARRKARRFDESKAAVDEAERIARRRGDPLMRLRALRERARLLAARYRVSNTLSREMAALAASIPDGDWASELRLLRDVARIAADADPSILGRALRLGAMKLSPRDLDFVSGAIGRDDLTNADAIEAELKRMLDVTEPPQPIVDALLEILRREEDPSPELATTIRLARSQIIRLTELLLDRYSSANLARFVEARFERALDSLTLGTSAEHTAFDLVATADREGWLTNLVVALVRANFADDGIQSFASVLRMGPNIAPTRSEEALPPRAIERDLARHRGRAGAVEVRTCAIESGEHQFGCGFLVAPNVILTAHSVLDALAERGKTSDNWSCRFDRMVVDGNVLAHGVMSWPSEDWRVRVTSAYALVKIARRFGDQPIDSDRAERGATRRGWIPVFSLRPFEERGSLLWLWRERRGTFMSGVAAEAALFDESRIGIELNATADAAIAGAPCVDDEMNVVAMHLGPSSQGRSAILPLATVFEDITRAGIYLPAP